MKFHIASMRSYDYFEVEEMPGSISFCGYKNTNKFTNLITVISAFNIINSIAFACGYSLPY